MTHDRMRQSYHSVLLQWFIADTISTETGTTGSGTVEFFYYELEYFPEFYLFHTWIWQWTMLQIYVTLCGRWFVSVCVCHWVYLELLSHFLPFKIHLTNISPILIKMADFKNLAWATSFATQASRKFIYLPYRASAKKKLIIPSLNNSHAHWSKILQREHEWRNYSNVMTPWITQMFPSLDFTCWALSHNQSCNDQTEIPSFIQTVGNMGQF